MIRFTDSPYEQMMQQIPAGREAQKPPALPPGHPCHGCPYRPCLGICYRKLLKGSEKHAVSNR